MNQVRCFNCGNICVKNGKTKAGTQRWLCKECSDSFTNPIDNSTKQFVQFQHWLFSKAVPVSYTHLTLPTICSV